MSDPLPTELARSAVEPAPPARIEHGWQVSGRRAVDRGATALRLTDCSPLTKTLLRADSGGAVEDAVAVPTGTACRQAGGLLTACMAPGEWLALGLDEPAAWPPNIPDRGLVTVVDVTHGLTLVSLTGAAADALLSKLCAVDLYDTVTPNGSAFRSLVAGVTAGVIRDDIANQTRYFLFSERSVGQHLFDALLDAGAEFGIDVDGFRAGES